MDQTKPVHNDMDNIFYESSTWNEGYSLGIPLIDNQHKRFFGFFDRLSQLRKTSNSETELASVIAELKNYSIYHFNSEEALISQINAEILEPHLKQHAFFIQKVEEFENALSYQNIVLFDQTLSFMRKWFLSHISEVDPKYVDFVLAFRPDLKA